MAEFIRLACGQSADIGTMYNAASDVFLDASILKGVAPAHLIHTIKLWKVSTSVTSDSTFKEKIAALGIDADTAANYFAGLQTLQGCGLYLSDDIGDALALQGACHQRVVTMQQRLRTSDSSFAEHLDMAQLKQQRNCTHVVVGVDWGLHNIFATKHYLKNVTEASVTDPVFHEDLSRLQAIVNAMSTSEATTDGSVQSLQLEHDLTIYSSAFQNETLIEQDLPRLKQFIQIIPDYINQENDGKGWRLSYVLMPLSMLNHFLPTPSPAFHAKSHNHHTKPIDGVVKVFDDFAHCEANLRSYRHHLTRHQYCVADDHLCAVDAAIKELLESKQVAATRLRKSLEKRQRGTVDASPLSPSCDYFSALYQSPYEAMAIVGQETRTIDFVREAVGKGAVYLGHNRISSDKVIQTQKNNDCYLFLFNKSSMDASRSWKENCALLQELLSQRSQNETVFVVDCDARSTYQKLEEARVCHIRNAQVIVPDVLQQRNFLRQQCFARFCGGSLDVKDTHKPVQRRFVKLPCPGKDCDPTLVCDWTCPKCLAPIECGFTDEYMYCDCGRGLYSEYEFRCNSNQHGADFQTFEPSTLFDLLRKLDQSDYVNILILGETGVGKSTFINAFINYLSYSNLDEAKAAERLDYVIPCSFCIQVMDRENPDEPIKEKLIQVGSRDDEANGSKGSSATQQTNVYAVTIGSTTYRLIDTPGIGDTRGLSHDKKNMADILDTLSSYDSLHGILILLKSNNARLTITFKFCIKELLVHLHRSAVENIAFGFTNTRISNYTPGDTFGPLKSLLQENPEIGLKLTNMTTYCFDSESFRYLASYKKGVPQSNEEDFRRSWDHSSKEAHRLIKHFRTKLPHNVISTLSLNGARQLVMELTKPMADISKLIRDNITLLEDQMKQLRDSKVTADNLRKKLLLQRIQFESMALKKPRTVCKRKSCCDFKDSGKGDGEVVTIYKTHCHPACRLKNVKKDVVADPGLLRCSAFALTNNCKVCSHHWAEHLHVLYELKEVTVEVKDTEVERQLQLNAGDVTLRQIGLRRNEQLIAEYREEHRYIQEAAARFGVFLWENSMTPINDAALEYLDMLIQDEKTKIEGGQQLKQPVQKNKKRLEGLEEDKRAHIELVETLKQNMNSGQGSASQSLDEKGVERVVKRLYALKHFGNNLQKVQHTVATAHRGTYRERPYRVRHTNGHGLVGPSSASKASNQVERQQRMARRNPAPPEQKRSRGSKFLDWLLA